MARYVELRRHQRSPDEQRCLIQLTLARRHVGLQRGQPVMAEVLSDRDRIHACLLQDGAGRMPELVSAETLDPEQF